MGRINVTSRFLRGASPNSKLREHRGASSFWINTATDEQSEAPELLQDPPSPLKNNGVNLGSLVPLHLTVPFMFVLITCSHHLAFWQRAGGERLSFFLERFE